jgi:hypothetical protein
VETRLFNTTAQTTKFARATLSRPPSGARKPVDVVIDGQ